MEHTNLLLPDSGQIAGELKRVQSKKEYNRTLRSTVYVLVTVAAVAVLVATLLLPVLRVTGTSMAPTLNEDEIVATVKTTAFQRGDLVAFYYNNKILIKRVIAMPGEWVDIDTDGNVTVNGEPLEEAYLAEKSLGTCDIKLPYQVPDGRFFVMGDHRAVSLDSRTATVGCVATEQMVGRLVVRIWPFSEIKKLT